MFCNQCGVQLPDGSKFCSNCGANLTVAPTAAPVTPQPQPATPPTRPQAAPRPASGTASAAPKKKRPLWLTVVVVLAAFLLGKFVIAPSMLSEPESNSGNPGSQIQENLSSDTEDQVYVPNAAYEAVFDDTYIVHFQTFFNLDMTSFAKKLEDGTVYCADYGHKNDVVIDFVETMYIPVSGYTDEQKAEVESNMKSNLSVLETLGCCTVKYNMSLNYLTVTMSYSGVDQPENYEALYNVGVLSANTFISMSETEKIMLNDGFVKK